MIFFNFNSPPYKDNLSKAFWFSLFLALIIVSAIWSLKTSGVLEMTTEWNGYPWGYKYIIKNYDLWPINKENSYYINQHQAFLGVDGAYVAVNSGFELHRSLYAAISTSLWFLGPLASLWTINILFWMLSIYSIVYVVSSLGGGRREQIITALLCFLGQGFVYSVGEFSPHIIGYGAMYCVYGFAVYHRIWDPKTTWHDYGQVYAVIGLLQMAYNSAWLSLPVVGALSLYRVSQKSDKVREFINLCLTGLMAIIPYGVMLVITKFFTKSMGVMSYTAPDLFCFLDFAKKFAFVYLEGFLGMSPLLCLLSIAAFIYAIIKKNNVVILLFLLGLLQIGVCTFFMLNVSGRGYVTFTCSATFVLLSVYALSMLSNSKKFFAHSFVTIFIAAFVICAHLPKISDMRLTMMGFYTGYINNIKQGKWQNYETNIIS